MKTLNSLLIGFSLFMVAAHAGAKFINKDTLEVTAKGKAKKSPTAIQNQSSCKEAARSEALRIAIETLVDLNWPNVRGKVSRKKYGEQVTQLTQGTIQGAHMTAFETDDSTDPVTCTVTLRVERLDPAATHKRVMQALGADVTGKKEILANPSPKKPR